MMNRRRLKQFLALCWVVVLVSGLVIKPVFANQVLQTSNTVWYVSPGGDGTNGLSWQTAYNDLQNALAAAIAGDEIWVAAGVYNPGSERTDSFHLVSGVALYGGFVGNELTRAERDWEVNLTILSGDIDGDDTDVDGDFIAEITTDIEGNNSYHVVYADGSITPIMDTTLLDGFIITAGQSNGSNLDVCGGGFSCISSGNGGDCSPSLKNVIFSGNTADEFGGAMCNYGLNDGISNPNLENIFFSGNRAVMNGGAMCNIGNNGGISSPRLISVTFSENTANGGGAIYNLGLSSGISSPNLTNVTFVNNTSEIRGGAIYNDADAGTSSPSMVNVFFSENRVHSGYGGAIYNHGNAGVSNPSLVNVTFLDNSASGGGAMYNGGFEGGTSSPRLVNVIFSGNLAGQSGGAMLNVGYRGGFSNSRLINVTFSDNSAGLGGAMYNVGFEGGTNSPYLTNVILWENHAMNGDQFYNLSSTVIIEASLVEGGVFGPGVYNDDFTTIINLGKNLELDPLFVDAENGDFHLQVGSPAIDAGTNDVITSMVDLDGNPRILDGDFSGEAMVDMGAYEASIPCPTGSILHVDKESPHPLLGEQWTTALHDLQFAFNVAGFCENITEVWVKAGVYTPGTEKEDSFHLAPGVAVYGGFTGNELTREERNWKTNSTILSGDVDGNDVNSDGNFIAETTEDIVGENSFHVVYLDGTETAISETTILDGFIITAGMTDDYWCGGGMFIEGENDQISTPILENLIFSGNKSNYSGGALCNHYSSSTIINVDFLGNEAGYLGGAVFNQGFTGICNPNFENVRFLKNAASYGGAMYSHSYGGESSPTLQNVLFAENSAIDGGAIYNDSEGGHANPSFVNVTFTNNKAQNWGGAMYNLGITNGVSNSSLTNVVLWANTAETEGDQIYNNGATFEIKTSILEGGLTEPGGVNNPSTVTDLGGNLELDPLFIDPDNGNYHLLMNSPAIDSGSNDLVTSLIDLDGNTRIIDGDQNGTDTVDMGAYEFHGYTLFVSAIGNGKGTIASNPGDIVCEDECDEDYEYNTLVTLTASSGHESIFVGWRGACTNTTGDCVVTMDDSKSVTAIFMLNQYPLSVSINGSGVGSVSSFPDGITCGEDCSENYDYNSVITLSATPEQGSVFRGWSGACTNTDGNCVVTMGGAKTVAAIFTLQYELSVTVLGSGHGIIVSQPEGIDCDDEVLDSCQEVFDLDTNVTLTATPQADSVFTGWSGACTNTTGDCVVTMDEVQSVTATFTLKQYLLSVMKNGTGSGEVSSDPSGISCGTDCQEEYNHSSGIHLIVTPAEDSVFSGWENCPYIDLWGDCNFQIYDSVTLTATFTLKQYTLSVHKAGTGEGEIRSDLVGIACGLDCQEMYDHNTTVTLTSTPEDGSTFAGWSGACTNTTGDCVVTMDEAKSVTATFTLNQYDLIVSMEGTGSGEVTSSPVGISCGEDCLEGYDYNTEVSLTATVDSGSIFAGWSGVCTNTTGDCVVTMDEAKSVTATFTLNQYDLTVNLDGSGSGMVSSSPVGISCDDDCQETYDFNTAVTLTGFAETGSTFAGWSGACTNTTGHCVVTMDEAKSVTATFMLNQYDLAVSLDGTGSGMVNSSPVGISCGVDCQESYDYNTVVTLTSYVDSSSAFAGWSGACTNTTGNCVVRMDAAKSVTATFTKKEYLIFLPMLIR